MNELVTTAPFEVDAPASNELDRAESLANYLAGQIRIGEQFRTPRVSLGFDEARELCQLLHDSLRTAKQLRQQHGF